MLWGVSSVALYVPWAGGAGPWISLSLWLWLGVLDAVQGVGMGMILLQTLSRLHVCATLAFSQMLGSVVVIVARATVSPQLVFPDFGLWTVGNGFKHSPFTSIPFWVALACQIIIVFGYFWYYRKEQLGTWYRVTAIFISNLWWTVLQRGHKFYIPKHPPRIRGNHVFSKSLSSPIVYFPHTSSSTPLIVTNLFIIVSFYFLPEPCCM